MISHQPPVPPIFFDCPVPHELNAEPGPYFGGAQKLKTSFVKALLAEDDASPVLFVTKERQVAPLAEALAPLDPYNRRRVLSFARFCAMDDRPVRAILHCMGANLSGAIHLSITQARGRWPVTGMTHDLLEPAVIRDLILAHFIEHWPLVAVACATRSSRSAYRNLLSQLTADRARRKRIALPIIAHGVDLGDQPSSPPSHASKVAARRQFKIPPESFVVLYLGRLSLTAKADLLALIQAFGGMRMAGPRALVLAGSQSTPSERSSLIGAADKWQNERLGCKLIILENPTEKTANTLFQAADVFASPANSLQESFGLALVEAMGAGLPIVATDWNGYRDIVRHERTGFLIPTRASRSRLSATNPLHALEDASYLHEAAAKAVEVCSAALEEALERLAIDCEQRERMAVGAMTAARGFTIQRMVHRYKQLWTLLADISAKRPAVTGSGLTLSIDDMFAHHPSEIAYPVEPDAINIL